MVAVIGGIIALRNMDRLDRRKTSLIGHSFTTICHCLRGAASILLPRIGGHMVHILSDGSHRGSWGACDVKTSNWMAGPTGCTWSTTIDMYFTYREVWDAGESDTAEGDQGVGSEKRGDRAWWPVVVTG
ncbi:hypothetical protein CA951_13670 [Rhodococcus sp. NCIMB 12038]|nr:hypothetical protein CA951_13670 [Rhodococcus sp. NCIMB 12038]